MIFFSQPTSQGGFVKEDIRHFQNPSGYWEHDGAFSVELTDDADKSIAPAGAKIEGNTIRVDRGGRIKQTMGGIQLHMGNQPFFWGYEFMKVIRDGAGKLLWVNYEYR